MLISSQSEIATHLKVVEIRGTDIYDQVTNVDEALTLMRQTYEGNNWANQDADLHHALLSTSGGGLAYQGQICDRNFGFGVSGDMTGKFQNLDSESVWDMYVFAHEVGHNFGSDHTHAVEQYDPAIDTCGCVDKDVRPFCAPGETRTCPANIQDKSGTIMSYCHMW